MQLLKLLLVLPLTLTLSACGKSAEDGSSERVQKEGAEAYDALKAYATKKKIEFEKQVETTLESLDKQTEALKARAKKASGEAKKKITRRPLKSGTRKKTPWRHSSMNSRPRARIPGKDRDAN